MDIVNFGSQERVDLPDMTQVSYLVLGEFRRTVRSLIMGDEAHYALRGFAVEPAGTPDTTVTVKLDPGGGGPLGALLLSEDTGALEYGQLVGDKNSTGVVEGNAQQILDFSGQPDGTYAVEVRFVYSDSANDNRAFWNETTNVEFIAAHDTRSKPVWQAQRVLGAGSGGAWMKLADVVWLASAGDVDSADITDTRPFIFEGTGPTYSAATQATYTAVPDFDRSATRGADGVNAVYPAIRALARQIADLKGQNSSGSFDWFSRVFAPRDPVAALSTEQTKSLRTVETVTFTIGNGTTTFGDFNGATGLEDCLQHLEGMGASCPEEVRIVAKGDLSSTFTYNITTAHAINSGMQRLRIDMGGQGINLSLTAGLIAISGVVGCEISNAKTITDSAGGNGSTLLSCQIGHIHHVATINGTNSATANPMLELQDGSHIHDIGAMTGALEVTPRVVSSTIDDELDALRPIVIQRAAWTGAIRVNATGLNEKQQPLRVRDCDFTNIATHALGFNGIIDILAGSDIVIEDSSFLFNPDKAALIFSSASPKVCRNLKVRNCKFYNAGTPSTGGRKAIEMIATNSTISECYFHINDEECGALLIDASTGVAVNDCKFLGLDLASRAVAASALTLVGTCNQIAVTGCLFDGWNPNQDEISSAERCIFLTSTATMTQLSIDRNQFVSNGGYCVDFGSAVSVDVFSLSNNSVHVAEAEGHGFNVDISTKGVIVGNTMTFSVAGMDGLQGGATGDAVVSGNRLHRGTINNGTAVWWGFSGAGWPGPNLNYATT